MENTQNINELKQLQIETTALQIYLEELDQTIQSLNKQQESLAKATAQSAKTIKELGLQASDTESIFSDFNKQLTINDKLLNATKLNLQQGRQMMAGLSISYDNLTVTQSRNFKQVEKLHVQMAAMVQTIDVQEKQIAKSSEAFDFQKKSIDALKSSFDTIKDSNKDFGPILDDAAKGFNAMKTGLGAVKTGFQSVGGAIKTTGFGALVLILQSLVSYFTETTEGSAMLRGAISAIGLVIDNVKKVFQGFGKVIVDAVSNPAETIKKVWNAVLENITNRFKGISVFFDGLFHADFKKMGDGIIQMGTGITNGTDKIKVALKKTKEFVTDAGKQIVKAYQEGTKASDNASATEEANAKKAEERRRREQEAAERHKRLKKQLRDADKQADEEAEKERLTSVARMAEALLDDYAKEVAATNNHFEEQKKKYAKHKETVEQLEKERVAALANITQRFQNEELNKLQDYHDQLARLQIENITDAKERATKQLDYENEATLKKYNEDLAQLQKSKEETEISLTSKNNAEKTKELEDRLAKLNGELLTLTNWKKEFDISQNRKKDEINGNNKQTLNEQPKAAAGEFANQPENENINQIQSKLASLQIIMNAEEAAQKQSTELYKQHTQQKLDLELQLTQSRMHLGDKFLDSVLKNSKKDSAIFKAAFIAKKATAVGDIIISTRKAIMESLHAYAGIPFIGQALGIAQAAFMAAQGATSIAQVVKQKPGYAMGGQFISDGRGALLPGYSQTDNTNAYLRSGEAVVVSEAMRNPWARNLVSAINVAHGGRDFSTAVKSGGYALGGVFTDGGNANRYYAQPVNDVKELANTLAYQMINNFPPVYVDVKDINNQQSILARTVDRVNL